MANPSKTPLGNSPASMTNRARNAENWCQKEDIESDPYCDLNNPVAVSYKHIMKTMPAIREHIPEASPLRKSRHCDQFKCDLYYKIESFNITGSFKDRGAIAVLNELTIEQKDAGVITSSWGNFGAALAYYGKHYHINVRIVFPKCIAPSWVWKCRDYGAKITLFGDNFKEAKRHAFEMAREKNYMYINGYDHPSVIAGCGTIGVEIMEQLPEVDVVIVPVGGGSLIAGVAVAVKNEKNGLAQIYGVQPDKCCCFFKAMDKDGVFETETKYTIASSLAIPTAGCNSLYTGKSLISKMILVDDDWIIRGMSHIVEQERVIVEGAGATGLAALFGKPNVVPELSGKTVVVIITGGNFSNILTLPKCLDRAKAVEGRIIKFTITVMGDDPDQQLHILSMISNAGGNLIHYQSEPAYLTEADIRKNYLTLGIQCNNIEHACQIKRTMNNLFPNQCTFVEQPFSPAPICICFPKKPFQPPGTKTPFKKAK